MLQVPEDKWHNIIVCYDNMCQLDGMKVANAPLPLPPPFDQMWLKVQKVSNCLTTIAGTYNTLHNVLQVIDSLHIKNHKNPKCHELYHPDKAHEVNENINLMCAEQTFVWLSRYKRILCSMNKNHHLFFLHRMITLRNRYTEWCHRTNRKPLLPKAKQKT